MNSSCPTSGQAVITNKRALTADPEHHLNGFGEAVTLVSVAERYLKEVY